MKSYFSKLKFFLWQILINYKFLSGKWNNISTVSTVQFVCSLQVSRGKSEKLNLAPVSATCSAWSHLSSAVRQHRARLQMKTGRDRLPVITALAWCALINYALAKRSQRKEPWETNFLLVACWHPSLRLSFEVAADLKASDPRFSSHFHFFSSPAPIRELTYSSRRAKIKLAAS